MDLQSNKSLNRFRRKNFFARRRSVYQHPMKVMRLSPARMSATMIINHMTLVSITEAAKLVRRNRSTLYRDIERGRLSKTVTPDGETQIDTAELLRAYGRLHSSLDEPTEEQARNKMRIAILEERTRALERALALEAELRRVKDQVTNELRARLADKENMIKILENKLLFLEYDKQVESLSPEDAVFKEENTAKESLPRNNPPSRNTAEKIMPRKGWWARFLQKR